MTIQIEPIGHIQTPFAEKFAIPRQAEGVSCARGEVHFESDYADPNTCRGLEQFSHIWLIFQFHETAKRGWSPTVRPPRLGGNQRIGVFATRSTHRPNAIGMSVVRLEGVSIRQGKPVLMVSSVDLLDGTPILDIKPYIPYADAIQGASGGYAQEQPQNMDTEFSEKAVKQLKQLCLQHKEAEQLICNVLGQDPRPAYRKESNDQRIYGVILFNHNVKWIIKDNKNCVVSIEPNP